VNSDVGRQNFLERFLNGEGWLAVLKMVPWADVVTNAPKVAEGAKKLWEAVAKKSPPTLKAPTGAQTTLSPDALAISSLESRVSDLKTDVADLQKEMIDSSRLIKALADQNTQLVQRVFWLTRSLFVVGMATTASLVLVLIH
jgi:hypothetical protein